MILSEFVKLLDGRQYRKEITREEELEAKKSGIVIVFGASDDLMEFRGAISGEIGAFNGTRAYLDERGLMQNVCDDDCPYFRKSLDKAKTIDAVWNKDGFSWTYQTTIPHQTFIIKEGDDTYCRGIVFYLSTIANQTAHEQ